MAGQLGVRVGGRSVEERPLDSGGGWVRLCSWLGLVSSVCSSFWGSSGPGFRTGWSAVAPVECVVLPFRRRNLPGNPRPSAPLTSTSMKGPVVRRPRLPETLLRTEEIGLKWPLPAMPLPRPVSSVARWIYGALLRSRRCFRSSRCGCGFRGWLIWMMGW